MGRLPTDPPPGTARRPWHDTDRQDLDRRLEAAQARIEELERLEEAYRVNLENLHLHQEELRTQNDELRRAQTSLEAARHRHQALFDFAPVAHFLVSASGMILKTNRSAADLLGLNVQELYGFHMPNLASDNRQRIAMLAFLEALKDGYTPPPLAVELFRRDGGSTRIELHGSRSGSQQETSLLLTAVSLKHHGELEGERRRFEDERRFTDALFDGCDLGIAVADAGRQIVRANPAFAGLLGCPAPEALGRNLEAIVAGGLDGPLNWAIWHALQEAGCWRGDMAVPHDPARRLPVKLCAVPDGQGRLRHFIAMLGPGG